MNKYIKSLEEICEELKVGSKFKIHGIFFEVKTLPKGENYLLTLTDSAGKDCLYSFKVLYEEWEIEVDDELFKASDDYDISCDRSYRSYEMPIFHTEKQTNTHYDDQVSTGNSVEENTNYIYQK